MDAGLEVLLSLDVDSFTCDPTSGAVIPQLDEALSAHKGVTQILVSEYSMKRIHDLWTQEGPLNIFGATNIIISRVGEKGFPYAEEGLKPGGYHDRFSGRIIPIKESKLLTSREVLLVCPGEM